MALDSEDLERLVKLEGEVRGLKEVLTNFITQSTANYEKMNGKLDTLIKENMSKPSFEHCTERKIECAKEFKAIRDDIKTVENNSISKTSATIFSLLMAAIGILGTLAFKGG